MFTKNDTKSRRNAVPSLLACDSKFVGNLISEGEIQLDGLLEGEIQVATLIIGNSGKVKGSVKADKVIVKGEIEGTLNAAQVRIEASATVIGDVYHDTLSIEAGARFEGQIKQRQESKNVTPLKPDGEQKSNGG